MEKEIILFSHGYHTFLLNEVEYAAKVYDQVTVLCQYNDELERKCKCFENVKYKTFNLKFTVQNIFKAFRLLKRDYLKDIFACIRAGKFDHHYVYIVLTSCMCESVLKDELRKHNNIKDLTVLSMWFAQTAYAAYRIKELYPEVHAYSMAHSFEVDDKKNSYIDYLLQGRYHAVLDGVFFISNKVREEYIEKHSKPQKWPIDKIKVSYLGTIKRYKNNSKASDDGVLRIITCSNCIPVKNIELLIDALKYIQDIDVEWTHFGDGPLLEKYKESSASIRNTHIHINWMGRQNNEFIHRYISENPIDLILNTSISEGIPVSLMEAIAYGVPGIVTDVGGNSEIIKDGVNGYLISEHIQPQELAAVINKFAILDQKEKERLRDNSLKIFDEFFDANKLRETFYENIKF